MTQARILKLIKSWQAFLGLEGWQIAVDWEEPSPPDTHARVWRSNSYDTAIVYLDREWRSWDQLQANKLIAHELLHLVARDLEEAWRSIERHVESPAWVALDERFEHELEGVIDRLAERLVELTYS